jgi:hypothetical protein
MQTISGAVRYPTLFAGSQNSYVCSHKFTQ